MDDGNKTVTLTIRLSVADRDLIRAAARDDDRAVSAWVRLVAVRKAQTQLADKPHSSPVLPYPLRSY